ncbi:MAG: ubiquitin-like protein Pup [Actinobacteria bacterium HGW-Actinobacteria-4]|nr:MAG: ubiquitin-like protein Pup [Actinobacteria bacterium HGW-Actinobacteria-4]
MPQTTSSGSAFDDESTPGEDGAPAANAAAHSSSDAIDDLLDQIDGSLQVNAEQFVRSFVQKGGQ